MSTKTSESRLFIKDRARNTLLNPCFEPDMEFFLYGDAFWDAARKLLDNDSLDRSAFAQFDARVIVYLYRHALELFLKAILFGRGAELVDGIPSREEFITHRLSKLLPCVRRIFVKCGWEKTFGSNAVPRFDDFVAIVKEFEDADALTFGRYPIRTDLKPALSSPLAFSIRTFAGIMDEVLGVLYGACDRLPDIANDQARASYEAWCEDMENSEHPECDPD